MHKIFMCAHCRSPARQRCGGCNAIHYCSDACAWLDSAYHKSTSDPETHHHATCLLSGDTLPRTNVATNDSLSASHEKEEEEEDEHAHLSPFTKNARDVLDDLNDKKEMLHSDSLDADQRRQLAAEVVIRGLKRAIDLYHGNLAVSTLDEITKEAAPIGRQNQIPMPDKIIAAVSGNLRADNGKRLTEMRQNAFAKDEKVSLEIDKYLAIVLDESMKIAQTDSRALFFDIFRALNPLLKDYARARGFSKAFATPSVPSEVGRSADTFAQLSSLVVMLLFLNDLYANISRFDAGHGALDFTSPGVTIGQFLNHVVGTPVASSSRVPATARSFCCVAGGVVVAGAPAGARR